MRHFDMRLQKDWMALRWRKGEVPRHCKGLLNLPHLITRSLMKRETPVTAKWHLWNRLCAHLWLPGKQLCCRSRCEAAQQCFGRKRRERRKQGEAALHSLAKQQFVSRGIATAGLYKGEHRGQVRLLLTFLFPVFQYRTCPALGNSSNSPEWVPWDRLETHSRQWKQNSF